MTTSQSVVAILVLITASCIATWQVQEWRYDAVLSKEKSIAAEQLTAAVQRARDIEQERQKVKDAEINNAKAENADLQAVVASASITVDGLREQIANLKRRASNPSAASGSPRKQDTDTIGLLADMYEQGKRDSLARSQYADQLRIAGLTCERLYDSLLTPR